MSTETQALAKGTRVDENDRHEAFLAHLEQASKIVASWPAWKQTLLGGTARMEQPEPTVGQMVDAMHQEIERVCRDHSVRLPIIDLDIFGDEVSFVSVKWVDEWITGKFENPEYSKGPTPQAALRAMIERLREIGKQVDIRAGSA